MHLHENEKDFQNAIDIASSISGIDRQFLEKDYYVYSILKGIVDKVGDCVVF